MPPKKRRPQPGGDCGASEKVLLGGFDTPRDSPQAGNKQEHPHRAGFARAMTFSEFGYRSARALDYDDFIDRLPSQLSATTWWRAAP